MNASLRRALYASRRACSTAVPDRQTTRAVPIFLAPSLDEFRGRILSAPSPTLVKSVIDAWPALRRWSDFSALRQPGSHLVVPVEVSPLRSGSSTGAGYNSAEFERIQMPYDDFIQMFMLREPRDDGQRFVAFLAQYTLLDDIPALQDDLNPPLQYALAGRGDQWRTNVWIGTAGTWTPLHRDPYHNLFCQIAGQKHVRFFPPSCAEQLYLLTDPFHKNTSSITSPSPDRSQFPRYYHALKDSWEVTVSPGDTLFLPKGYYHSVEGLSKSVSVNSWFL
ncbi:Clavaminate synthase-like protein [Auricularia subglabra TFB-10046 SS5]|nr:Clavaminate synthase-like protein [Auricularia subglabra TFB-10046 SS5]